MLRKFQVLAVSLLAAILLAASSQAGTTRAQTTTSPTASPAAELNVALDQLLSEHAVLAMLAMQKGYDGAADFPVVAAQLDKNSQAIAGAIASVYGPDAGDTFLNGSHLWRDHIKFFVEYTQGLASGDQAMQADALQNLEQYTGAITRFLTGANPNLPPDAVRANFQTHLDQLVDAINSYAAGDYARTYADWVQATDHMFMAGGVLSGAIAAQFPDKFPGSVSTAPVMLRTTLDRLLVEHAALAMLAMQKGYNGAPDFGAVAGQLDMNTQDIGAAVGSVYGAAAGDTFINGPFLWRNHIKFFVEFTQGEAKGDSAMVADANQNLDRYNGAVAKFLSGANPNLPDAAVQATFRTHINQLETALTSYASGDFAKTYATWVESMDHMFMSGGTLAGAIVAQFPQKFVMPTGLPNTGDGTCADPGSC